MKDNALLFGTLYDQPSLFTRLKDEFAEAVREFRTNPRAFVTATLAGNAVGGVRRRMLLRFGLATGIVLYAVVFAAILIFWTVGPRLREASETAVSPPTRTGCGRAFRKSWRDLKIKRNRAGAAEAATSTLTPPSAGSPPTSSFAEQLIAPTPEPQIKAPALPVTEIIPVDPRFKLDPTTWPQLAYPTASSVPISRSRRGSWHGHRRKGRDRTGQR